MEYVAYPNQELTDGNRHLCYSHGTVNRRPIFVVLEIRLSAKWLREVLGTHRIFIYFRTAPARRYSTPRWCKTLVFSELEIARARRTITQHGLTRGKAENWAREGTSGFGWSNLLDLRCFAVSMRPQASQVPKLLSVNVTTLLKSPLFSQLHMAYDKFIGKS